MLKRTPDKRLSVCAVLVDEDTYMPWMQFSLKRGWELVGGKVDAGESPDQAIRREIQEEVGIDDRGFKTVRLVGAINHEDWCCLCYVVLLYAGVTPVICEPEKVNEIRRMPRKEVEKMAGNKNQMWKRAIQVLREFWYPAGYKENKKKLDDAVAI